MTNLKAGQYDRYPRFLTGNALKILAAIFMTLDHIGVMLFPRVDILREKYMPDGLHPNDKGNEIIVRMLTKFIENL